MQNRLGPRRGHTTACRMRFTQVMEEDEVDRDRVERATTRQTEWLRRWKALSGWNVANASRLKKLVEMEEMMP